MADTAVVEVKAEEVKVVDVVATSMSEIEGAQDIEYKLIDGFKPGQKVWIGSLSAGDLIEWNEANEGEAKRTAGLRLISKSLVGPEPDRVRYATDSKNIAVFRRKSFKVTERVINEILAMNGMIVGAQTETKND